jgi:hypothetical protein
VRVCVLGQSNSFHVTVNKTETVDKHQKHRCDGVITGCEGGANCVNNNAMH